MLIAAENLACERGGRLVFSNIGFQVRSGEFLQLTGPNGAGKSSLLRLIANFTDQAAGRLEVQGGNAELTLAQQAHYIAHTDAAKSALTVTENLDFWCQFLGGTGSSTALARMNLHGLADYPVALLSAGQKRRLALARLLLVSRKIWLLDEPSVGLDAASQVILLGMMKEHLGSGGIVIAATHVPIGLTPDSTLELGARP